MPLNSDSNSSSEITPIPIHGEDPDTRKTPDKSKRITFAIPESSVSGDTGDPPVEEPTSKCDTNNEACKDALTVKDHGSINPLHAKSSGFIGFSQNHRKELIGDLSKQGTHSLLLTNKSQTSAAEEDGFLSSLITPLHSHTKEGKGVFEDLYLPPLPPPDMSHIIAPLPSKSSPRQVTSTTSSNCDTLGVVPEDGETTPRNTSQATNSSESISAASDLPTKSPSSPGHSQSRKKPTSHESSARLRKGNSKTLELSKDKLFRPPREKYCPTGTCTCIKCTCHMHVYTCSRNSTFCSYQFLTELVHVYT